jgi:AraC-like DNA-binding protein
MSTRELQRYLLENYNKTFIELKNEARMSYAKNKLLYTNLSITEISELIGYSSIEHFTNAFKRYFGLSPLKYRKAYDK